MKGSMLKLEVAVQHASVKIRELKKMNKVLKGEINELRRIQALNEKKTQRLSRELDKVGNGGSESWQACQKDIRRRLLALSAKLSAFEKTQSVES